MKGCSLSFSPCVFLFLTPLLFKQASEHLNDQNSATWLSAPALSNLDRYVSASERGRHGWYTYTTQVLMHTCACTHTHRFAHKSSVTSPDRQMPLGIPGSWAKQKSVKMCSSVEMQSVIQLSKTGSYLFSWRLEGKRPESFYSTFTHSSTVKFKLNNFLSFCVLQEITVLKMSSVVLSYQIYLRWLCSLIWSNMFWIVMDSNQTLKKIGSKRIWQTQILSVINIVYVEAVRALWFDDVFCIFFSLVP